MKHHRQFLRNFINFVLGDHTDNTPFLPSFLIIRNSALLLSSIVREDCFALPQEFQIFQQESS